jgi:hypothetical protein
MRVKAESVSLKRDGRTLCHPSDGYAQETLIKIDDYIEVSVIEGVLPPSDDVFPKGAPMADQAKVGKKLLTRKPA